MSLSNQIITLKILHTADWHLGKKLDFFSRLPEQVEVMEEICQIADDEAVDMVIVAGDLFDAFNPPTEAIDLLYKTLKRLTNNGQRPVIAIAGNHDSPSLIDAPDPLAREIGIIMIGYPNAEIRPFELEHFKINQTDKGFFEIQLKHLDYPVRVMHTAYANEQRLKEYLGEEKDLMLNQILADHWQETTSRYCDDKGVNLLATHLYMMKRGGELIEEPEGEKPIKIGNADLVYTEAIPPQVQYTALGHLHGYRNVGSQEKPVIYSSSPLAYSFSEAGQQKYVSIVEAEPGVPVSLKKISLKKGKQLARKTFDDIQKAVDWLSENRDTLVELTIESDHFMTATARKRLYETHKGIIHLIPKVKMAGDDEHQYKKINLSDDIRSLFKDYFKSKNEGQEPNEEIMGLFDEILKESL